MKMGTKLLSIAGAVLAAGALATSPMLASASDPDVDAAAFLGETTSLTPVQLVGGAGSYTFDSDHFEGVAAPAGLHFCVGVGTDPDAGVCAIASSGAYVNTVCGTGSVTGASATISETGPGVGGPETDNYTINITFVAGVGVVMGTGIDGVVVLLPDNSAGAATPPACTNAFSVVGAGVTTG
jgi:hypothetical protein